MRHQRLNYGKDEAVIGAEASSSSPFYASAEDESDTLARRWRTLSSFNIRPRHHDIDEAVRRREVKL